MWMLKIKTPSGYIDWGRMTKHASRIVIALAFKTHGVISYTLMKERA